MTSSAIPKAGPFHHPPEDLLLDYVTGASGEAEALIVAAHLTFCPSCRREAGRLEALGGAALEEIAPAPLAEDSLAAVMAMIDRPESRAPERKRTNPELPAPLCAYLDRPLRELDWKVVMRGKLDEFILPIAPSQAKVKLLRIRAGAPMPRHTHEGREMTLVLEGSFEDGHARFSRGDLSVSDAEIDHRPVAGEEADCLCLVVTDAPLRLTGPVGRFLNPFLKF